MKKLTVSFRLRTYGWEGLQERDELAREEECVNCREGILSEVIKGGKEDHKGGDLDNNVNMEDGQIVSGVCKGSSFLFS